MNKKIKISELLKNQKGLTLVELIVAVIFLVIVMTVASLMFSSGNYIFGKSTDQYDLQSSVRSTSDFIVNQTRNASTVSLTTPPSPSAYNQIYLSANCIVYKPAGGTPVNKTEAIIKNASDLSFSLVSSGSKYMLVITIKGTKDSSTYDITTKILLNNVQSATAINNQTIVYYK